MEWTDKNGKPLKKGDVVEWGAGHKGTVVELSSFGIRVQGYGMRGLEEWSGSSSQVRKVSNSRIVSTNEVVRNALKAKACNAKYKVGDRVVLPLMDGGKRVYTVLEVDRNGDPGWYLITDANGSSETVRWDAMKPAKNSSVATNAVDPLDALNSAETFMRQAIGELGKVTDPDFHPFASKIAVKLRAVQSELRRELEG